MTMLIFDYGFAYVAYLVPWVGGLLGKMNLRGLVRAAV